VARSSRHANRERLWQQRAGRSVLPVARFARLRHNERRIASRAPARLPGEAFRCIERMTGWTKKFHHHACSAKQAFRLF
jgi:hypothetical protein